MSSPPDSARSGRRLARVLAAAFWLGTPFTAGCASGHLSSNVPGSARAWAQGPVRWLMLPDEAKKLHRLSSSSEALAFIEAFWQRRDPDPESPGNPFAQRFFERVQSADILYPEPGRAGSLTDRGRALILLGAPSILRYTQRAAPTWDPGEGGRSRRPPATERVRVEVWAYTREDLPPALVARLEDEGQEFPVEVSFVEAEQRTLLVDGEDLLEEAARAAVREGE